MQEHELRASLASIGPLLPAFVYRDQLIDGARRTLLCNELGLHLPTRYLRSLHDACSVLWPLHAERAIALAGDLPLLEIAKLCGAEPASIAAIRARTTHKQEAREPKIRLGRRQKSVLLQVWVEPQLKEYAERAGEVLNLNTSAVVREAVWRLAAVTVPRAPLQPPKHIRTRERSASLRRSRASG